MNQKQLQQQSKYYKIIHNNMVTLHWMTKGDPNIRHNEASDHSAQTNYLNPRLIIIYNTSLIELHLRLRLVVLMEYYSKISYFFSN